MKVLHIGKYFPPFHGGIENFMFDLMAAQRDKGYKVQAIVHHHHTGVATSFELLEGIAVRRVRQFGVVGFVPLAPSFGYWLWRTIKRFRPDVLQMHMPNVSCFWGLGLIAAKQVPWVVHWHGDVEGNDNSRVLAWGYPFYRPFEQALLRRARSIIATSLPYLTTSKALSAFREKAQVVPLGMNDPLKHPTTVSVLEQEPVFTILIVGRLSYFKGHLRFLEAVKSCVDRGMDFRVWMVGDGELYKDIRNRIEHYGLVNVVKLLGHKSRHETLAFMQRSHLLCLPSIDRAESFGLVLLEAMALSRACCVTSVPGSGMSWVVKEGETGLVANADDVEDIAGKIMWALQNREALAEMGRRGRQRYLQQFSMASVTTSHDDLYRELLAKPTSTTGS